MKNKIRMPIFEDDTRGLRFISDKFNNNAGNKTLKLLKILRCQ
jgi:hypothetical protein